MNKDDFIRECSKININITESIYNNLLKYVELIKEWNNKFNLTAITDTELIFLKHFYDSLCLSKTIDLNNINSLCDIGSGAGIPGIVLKIVFKNLKITLIESSLKKCKFLNVVITDLNLKDIFVVNDRAEVYARNNREKFDVVTCRGVAALKVISELCLPMVKVNGYFLPFKANLEEEIKNIEIFLKELDSKLENVIKYNLPVENAIRSIPVIKKLSVTNILYPREYNKIVKKA